MIAIFSHALLCHPFSQGSKRRLRPHHLKSPGSLWGVFQKMGKNDSKQGPLKAYWDWAPKSLKMVTAAMKLKDTCFLEGNLDKHRWYIKKERHHFADKGQYSQNYGFSSSHIWIWELNHKEVWVLKNWCFFIVVLEKTLESPLGFKEIKLFNPKGNQHWIFIGRAEAESETLILWSPDPERWLMDKDWWQNRDRESMRWLDSTTDSVHMILSKLWEIVEDKESCCAVVHGIAKSWTALSNWSTILLLCIYVESIYRAKIEKQI